MDGPIVEMSQWEGTHWRRLEGRPDINVMMEVEPINRTPWGRVWIIRAEMGPDSGPLEGQWDSRR